MARDYEPVIGLEIHAELQTESKMFCGCAVVDPTEAAPNTSVCPVCAGMPGVLPVVNARAVEYALRVALAGKGGGVAASRDLRDLGGGKGDYLGTGVIAIHHVEIMEVPACSTQYHYPAAFPWLPHGDSILISRKLYS